MAASKPTFQVSNAPGIEPGLDSIAQVPASLTGRISLRSRSPVQPAPAS